MLAHVAKPLAQLPPSARHRLGRAQVGDAHQREGDQHRDEAGRVDQEADPDAHRGDQPARHGRPHRPRAVDHRAVEADRVLHPAAADHLHHEGLPGGVVERVDAAEQHGDGEDHPELDGVRHRQQPEQQGEQRHRRLRAEEEAPLVQPVGHQARVGAQQQHRQELRRHHQAEQGARPGDFQHQPDERDRLHPGPDQADRLAGEVEAEVGHAQGVEQPGRSNCPGRSRPCVACRGVRSANDCRMRSGAARRVRPEGKPRQPCAFPRMAAAPSGDGVPLDRSTRDASRGEGDGDDEGDAP